MRRFVLLTSVYASIVTALLIYVVAGQRSASSSFDEITVHRINIVEPDGTLRTVFSNRDSFPGTYIHGEEHPREDRPTGGFIFLDDEGSEIGGLVFGGQTNPDGTPQSHGHLSFDQLNATQVFAVSAWEQDGERASRLYFSDWRERPGENGRVRMTVGKVQNGEVGLRINDDEGQARILLRVMPDGQPELVFLDSDGAEIARLPQPDQVD